MKREKKLEEVKKNYAYYQSILKSLEEEMHGQYMLIKNAKDVGYYDTIEEANSAAHAKFDDGLFSIQKVAQKPVKLGLYRHAYNLRKA